VTAGVANPPRGLPGLSPGDGRRERRWEIENHSSVEGAENSPAFAGSPGKGIEFFSLHQQVTIIQANSD
jgi:hypothetical protein